MTEILSDMSKTFPGTDGVPTLINTNLRDESVTVADDRGSASARSSAECSSPVFKTRKKPSVLRLLSSMITGQSDQSSPSTPTLPADGDHQLTKKRKKHLTTKHSHEHTKKATVDKNRLKQLKHLHKLMVNNDVDELEHTIKQLQMTLDQVDPTGTLLLQSIRSNTANTLKTLCLYYKSLKLQYTAGELPLHTAIKLQHAECLKPLLDYGLDLDLLCGDVDERCTALHYAVKKHDNHSAELLLQRGANPNIADIYGSTPLHSAVISGDRVLVSKLLHSRACVDSSNSAGWTALHLGIAGNRLDIVAELLSHSAAVNIANAFGKTALHLACRHNNIGAVELLLDHRANTLWTDVHGKTPGDYATDPFLRNRLRGVAPPVAQRLVHLRFDVGGKSLEDLFREQLSASSEQLSTSDEVHTEEHATGVVKHLLAEEEESDENQQGADEHKLSRDTGVDQGREKDIYSVYGGKTPGRTLQREDVLKHFSEVLTSPRGITTNTECYSDIQDCFQPTFEELHEQYVDDLHKLQLVVHKQLDLCAVNAKRLYQTDAHKTRDNLAVSKVLTQLEAAGNVFDEQMNAIVKKQQNFGVRMYAKTC